MPGAYGVDLRVRVVESVNEGMNYDEASEIFNVGVATVKRWVYRYRDEGHVLPRSGYQNGHSHKLLDDEGFIELVKENPSRTSDELAQLLGQVSSSTVRKKLKDLKFSRKKTFLYTERDEKKRAKFRRKIAEIDPRKIVYLDECGFDTHEKRLSSRDSGLNFDYRQNSHDFFKGTHEIFVLTKLELSIVFEKKNLG